MKKVLTLLIFLMLLCIPQDAGAWGRLWLIFDDHWDTNSGVLLSDNGNQNTPGSPVCTQLVMDNWCFWGYIIL